MSEKVLQMAIQIPASMIDELGTQAFIDEAARAARAAAAVMAKRYIEQDRPGPQKEKA